MTASIHRTGRPRSADFTTPLTIPGGAVAGAEIVRELPPEVALPAWQTLRSVLMWAAEEPGQRSDLFEPCAMADWERELLEGEWEPDLRVPLAVLVGELSRASQAAPDAIAHACLCVADWALENNGVATALAFAEAAALAWPQNPRYAWMAGRLLRTFGRLREAEQWLKRAARAAVTARDPDAQALALNSLGIVHYDLGNYPKAESTLIDGLRAARKHRLRDREGEILHDLCCVTTWRGDLDSAERFAREAFEIYRHGHTRLPALAHDVSVIWMKRGHFARALVVLRELPEMLMADDEQARVLSMLARAAAACGDEPYFMETWTRAWSMLEASSKPRRAAPDFMELGLGASSLAKWDMAEYALRRALTLSRETGEADVQARAEAALGAVAAHRSAERERNPIDTCTPPYNDILASGVIESLRQIGSTAAAA